MILFLCKSRFYKKETGKVKPLSYMFNGIKKNKKENEIEE